MILEVIGLFLVLKLSMCLWMVIVCLVPLLTNFSHLKRVKIWLRSTMSQTRLNSVLLLHVHRELSPNMKSVMSEFIGLNDTRRRIFGNICQNQMSD
jgi:hypothetical protein